ncbi:MAG: hypothetical protein LBL73_12275 [Synergistaceae bacterium]|nr:hypothetical protein [Synergistaceae bacterium]
MIEAAEYVRLAEGSEILKFPVELYTEMLVLGAEARSEVDGLPAPRCQYHKIEELKHIPRMDEHEQIQSVIECLRSIQGRNIMLKIQPPYSLLASVSDLSQFLRWLVKNEDEIRCALEGILLGLTDYVKKALQCGVGIVSLVDPFGLVGVLGEDKYRAFAGEYTARLLWNLTDCLDSSLIHVCPRCSRLLEDFRFLRSERIECAPGSYINMLLALSKERSVRFVGHQCINKETTDHVYILSQDL